MAGRLYLDFCGEERAVEPGGSLTFGRGAALHIDDNPYLHRLLGRFVDRGGWRLEHLGRSIPLSVRDLNGPSRTSLAPGSSVGLTHDEFAIGFEAGPTRYELVGSLEERDAEGPEELTRDPGHGERTLEWARVELNPDQRLLLLALCEPRLVDPTSGDAPIPTNRQGATRLGWTMPKFNRKLDHLCLKLHRAGVRGVHGVVGASAADRRARLVEHATSVGLVTVDELALIDPERAA